jgi:GNAT superfamily N-acetyltransferase
LLSLGEPFVSNYTILNGKELDLFSDKLKLAIEYCGLYWHNEGSPEPRGKWYHYNKYAKCLDKKIRLITIYSDEWINRKPQVKNLIKSVLGYNTTRIFARKCSILELDKNIAKTFINNNHIQECRHYSKIYFGLIYENKLIGVLSLRNHHRNSKLLVLDRLCFLDEYIVIGGASKLLNKAVAWAKNNNYNQIISWSDNRYSQGNVYEKIGFILDQELPPDYSYVSPDKKYRVSKQSMIVPAGINEKEYTLNLGFNRIWDCGKKRYVYKIN